MFDRHPAINNRVKREESIENSEVLTGSLLPGKAWQLSFNLQTLELCVDLRE